MNISKEEFMQSQAIIHIEQIMGAVGEPSQVAEELFDFVSGIENESAALQCIRHIFTNFHLVFKSGLVLKNPGLSSHEWCGLVYNLKTELDKKFKIIFDTDWVYRPTIETCKKIVELIQQLGDRKKAIFTITLLLGQGNYVPMFYDWEKEGALRISDEKFQEIVEKNRLVMLEVLKIRNSIYESWDQRASAVMYFIDSLSNHDEKIVALTEALLPRNFEYVMVKNIKNYGYIDPSFALSY